jgi:hypothetical protein
MVVDSRLRFRPWNCCAAVPRERCEERLENGTNPCKRIAKGVSGEFTDRATFSQLRSERTGILFRVRMRDPGPQSTREGKAGLGMIFPVEWRLPTCS